MMIKSSFLFLDPAIKAHIRRLLCSGQTVCEDTESLKAFRAGIENNSRNRSTNCDERSAKNSELTELSISLPQNPTGVQQQQQNAVRSNGSCSDASGSSEMDVVIPQFDNFKEEERAQWEPLSGDKFGRQKNTPRCVEFEYNEIISIINRVKI